MGVDCSKQIAALGSGTMICHLLVALDGWSKLIALGSGFDLEFFDLSMSGSSGSTLPTHHWHHHGNTAAAA